MYWLDNPSGVPQKPAEKPVHSTTRLYFTEGGSGQAPSYPGEEWFNMVQEELLNIISEANLSPDKTKHTQLAEAIKDIIVTKKATTSEFGSVRKATDAEALLGQAIGAMMDAKNVADYVKQIFCGQLFYWPTATPPSWAISLAGQAINQTTDPILYSRYGATAPDMRGNVARGADLGRGIDTGRVLLSEQLDQLQKITGTWLTSHSLGLAASASGAFELHADMGGSVTGTTSSYSKGFTFDSSRVARSGNETRMRNVAWHPITMRG